MPRPKIYKNREQRRLAACAKAKRHYEKNSSAIKERKKIARRNQLEELEQQEIEARKDRQRQRVLQRGPATEREWQEQVSSDTRFYNKQYDALKKRLFATILKDNPRQYFEDIYQVLVTALSSNDHPARHLEAIRGSFEYRMGQKAVEDLWSQVWNSVGSGSLLDKFGGLKNGYRAIERALSDLELGLLEECLIERHERAGFMFQSKSFLMDFQDIP